MASEETPTRNGPHIGAFGGFSPMLRKLRVVKGRLAGTTGLEPATSDVTGPNTNIENMAIYLILQ